MKYKLLFINLSLMAIFSSILSSCGKSNNEYDPFADVEMIPVKVSGDVNYSFYLPDGTIMYRDQLPLSPSLVQGGVFSMNTPYGLSLYSTASTDTPKMLCSGLAYAGVASDGILPIVRQGGRIEIINTKGEPVATVMPYDGLEATLSNNKFSENMLPVAVSGNWGYVDNEGNWAIKPEYFYAFPFSEDKAVVILNGEDGKHFIYAIIDNKGKELYRFPSDMFPITPAFENSELLCKENNSSTVYKFSDKFELSPMPEFVHYISQLSDDYLVFSSENYKELGVIDSKGSEIIPASYNRVEITHQNQFIVNNSNSSNWQILDDKGAVVKDFTQTDDVMSLGRFGIAVKGESGYTILDSKSFEPISNNSFSLSFSGPLQNYVIYSNYLDWDLFAQDILSLINNKGVGRYNINDYASEMSINTSSFKDNTVITLDDLKIQNNKYSAEVYATFEMEVASLFMSFFTGTYEYQLKILTIDFDTEIPTNMQTSAALQKVLEQKGFSLTDVTKSDASRYAALYKFSNDFLGAYVEFVPGQKTGFVSVYPFGYLKYTENLRNNIAKYNSH